VVFRKQFEKYNMEELIEKCFVMLEMARDSYTAAYTPVYFQQKTIDAGIVVGGYGGELFRDLYSRSGSLEELIRSKYIDPNFFCDATVIKNYVQCLQNKFGDTLGELGENNIKKAVEKIYALEKMRYWGGSRTTAFNQYCYYVHPLLDHLILRYTFDIPISTKAGGQLQKWIITQLSPAMSVVDSSYNFNMHCEHLREINEDSAAEHPLLKKPLKIYRKIRKIYRQHRKYRGSFSSRLEDSAPKIFDHCGIQKRWLHSKSAAGRFLTVARLVERYATKLH